VRMQRETRPKRSPRECLGERQLFFSPLPRVQARGEKKSCRSPERHPRQPPWRAAATQPEGGRAAGGHRGNDPRTAPRPWARPAGHRSTRTERNAMRKRTRRGTVVRTLPGGQRQDKQQPAWVHLLSSGRPCLTAFWHGPQERTQPGPGSAVVTQRSVPRILARTPLGALVPFHRPSVRRAGREPAGSRGKCA